MAEHHKRCPKDMDPMWGQCACDVIDGLLADLRAAVEGLDVRCTEDPWRNEELTDWVRRDAVLALLDEVQP